MKVHKKKEGTHIARLTIGEVAKNLNIKPFVIRFWEKEFNLKSRRSAGGQRSYSRKEIEEIAMIKTLLHDQGFTIAGAKKHLQELRTQTKQAIAITGATRDHVTEKFVNQLNFYKTELLSLKKIIHNQIA